MSKRRRTKPGFSHCYACNRLQSNTAIERHHYPVPSRHRGLHTIPLCMTCHDLIDRINLGHWPKEYNVQGIRDLMVYAPELIVMWFSREDLMEGLQPDAHRFVQTIQQMESMPKKLSQIPLPEQLILTIHDLSFAAKAVALKMLPHLFDDDPDDAVRWRDIVVDFDPKTECLLLRWEVPETS